MINLKLFSTKTEKEETNALILGALILVILLVLAGIFKALIVEEGVTIELDELLYGLFSSAAIGIASVAFIIHGIVSEHNLIRMISYSSGFLLSLTFIFGAFIAGVIVGMEMFLANLAVLFALAFLMISIGIYALRRA